MKFLAYGHKFRKIGHVVRKVDSERPASILTPSFRA